jgi:hypothetical protein
MLKIPTRDDVDAAEDTPLLATKDWASRNRSWEAGLREAWVRVLFMKPHSALAV